MRKIKPKRIIYLGFILLLLFSNLIAFYIFSYNDWLEGYFDVQRKENGNTLICRLPLAEIFEHPKRVANQIPVKPNSSGHKIFEVDQYKNVVWEFSGLAYPHDMEVLPNDHILVADTAYDRVIEINYPNKDIVWSWEPAKINWTEVNPEWIDKPLLPHYYLHNFTYDWTHLNNVEFKNYGSYDACLISIRNFDLIVEVNYTAERIGPSNNPDNIIWWYGDYRNVTLISRQHNPIYTSYGTIYIPDSGNNRIIEINMTTNKIIWNYSKGLDWPRGVDKLENGNLLITDSLHNRIIEIEKDSKKIVWSYTRDLIIPYDADRLENGNTLISNGYSGIVYEVNRAGEIVWRYGLSFDKSMIYLNVIIMLGFSSTAIIFISKDIIKRRELTKFRKEIKGIKIGILIIPIIFSLLVLFSYTTIIGNLVIETMKNILLSYR